MFRVDVHDYDNGSVGDLIVSESFETLKEAESYAEKMDSDDRRIYVLDSEGETVWDC